MANSENAVVSPETMRDSVVSMAIESWRFARTFERLLGKLDAGEQVRYISQYNWFMKKVVEALNQVNLWVVNFEGQPFDIGMSATPLNIDEFDPENDTLIVDKVLEPTIMGKDGLVKTGTITLRKA